MSDRDLVAQLRGYSLTTAEIFYRMPDFPAVLQSFVWQDYDIAPRFPKLIGFLDFWRDNLDGQLFKIRVAHNKLVSPAEFRYLDGKFVVH